MFAKTASIARTGQKWCVSTVGAIFVHLSGEAINQLDYSLPQPKRNSFRPISIYWTTNVRLFPLTFWWKSLEAHHYYNHKRTFSQTHTSTSIHRYRKWETNKNVHHFLFLTMVVNKCRKSLIQYKTEYKIYHYSTFQIIFANNFIEFSLFLNKLCNFIRNSIEKCHRQTFICCMQI